MEKLVSFGFIFIVVSLVGFYLAYLYGRKAKRFKWTEYGAILAGPVLSIIILAVLIDIKILTLFLVSASVGFLLEYVVGLTYHKTLNKRLWRYERLSIDGYSSLLSVPIWGIAGVIFWFLGKMIGL